MPPTPRSTCAGFVEKPPYLGPPFPVIRQDAHSIYFLMEAVTAGEMWSIIYEGASGFGEGELPIEHGRYGWC